VPVGEVGRERHAPLPVARDEHEVETVRGEPGSAGS
jgi:hypothetical protein